ncbi:TonB family protein [Rufibacter radiotolerans]|uniref:TonB family protein n=1 Tax=Rufibacter radiotolerans TaxID=1379910 RepID=UPI0018CEAEAE|nr:TonB family protein [Rufibacter radiotolerans]
MLRFFYSFFLLLLPFVTLGQQQSLSAYQQEIARHRAQEDSVFKHSEKSPLTPEDKAIFVGLAYFPVQEVYKVKARFVRTAQEGIFKMPTTGTRTPEYVKYGELHFAFQGQPLRLNVYQNQELMKQVQYSNYLFIPFTDATTGHETYATGRYLDFSIPVMGQDSVWVDFNKAYNPSCAYSAGYSCPIPPKENKLPVRVEAGVKNYEKPFVVGVIRTANETLPEYPGGMAALYKYLASQFRMPTQAIKNKISGTVLVEFTIKKDGSLEDFEVLKSLDPEVDRELIRILKRMPYWIPSRQDGKRVNFRYRMPYTVVVK